LDVATGHLDKTDLPAFSSCKVAFRGGASARKVRCRKHLRPKVSQNRC